MRSLEACELMAEILPELETLDVRAYRPRWLSIGDFDLELVRPRLA